MTVTTTTTAADMAIASETTVAYWNANMPEAEHTDTCPEFLQNLTVKDRGIIGSNEDDYTIMTWPDVQGIVATSQLARFDRAPLSLRKYLHFLWELRRRYGSVGAFVLGERLRWEGPPVVARGAPFEFEDDVCVLQNDWPYGVDPRIMHLVVWTKFRLPGDDSEELPAETKTLIESYVDRTFRAHMPPGTVEWFKNWSALKSVDAVEHFHVLLFDPDPEFVRRVTGGVVPLYLQPAW